jgi:ATP phosphoribosyltransferase regulatory subunit
VFGAGPTAVGSLAHPLPSGMRDLLPAEAEAQGKLASCVLEVFELHGYQQVSVPAFEYADVLERGLGTIDPTSVLRFVEPETGEVVALRPDMTPQVARLVSTRLGDQPSPARLSYRGSVLRRQHERARHDQQALQAGIELIGSGGTSSDLEVISVCATAARAAGLASFVLDLGHGGIATSLLEGLSSSVRRDLVESLSLKDGAELARRSSAAKLPPELSEALARLVGLQGGAEVFQAAEGVLKGTPAWPHVKELKELFDAIVEAGIAPKIVVDLGETRAAAYYTGPTFQILAEGPGQAVASGGRYDALYGLFGAARPAAGAAIQLDHLRWALRDTLEESRARVVVERGEKNPTEAALFALRAAKIPCVSISKEETLDYARAWRYSHVARPEGVGFRLFRVGPTVPSQRKADPQDLGAVTLEELPARIQA